MTGICAQQTAAVDVNLPLQIATLDASIGRKPRLQGSRREGPECAPLQSFDWERETGFTALRAIFQFFSCYYVYRRLRDNNNWPNGPRRRGKSAVGQGRGRSRPSLTNWGLPPATPALGRSGRQLVEERLRLFQIARVKPLSEPPVDGSKQFAGLLHLALIAPQLREARRGA
jgi:hypothetical protein